MADLYQCDDCKDFFPVTQLNDTMAGVMCDECHAAWIRAAESLVGFGKEDSEREVTA